MFNTPRGRLLTWICMVLVILTGAVVQFGNMKSPKRIVSISSSGQVIPIDPIPTTSQPASAQQEELVPQMTGQLAGLPTPNIINDGKCVDIVDGIDDGVPTSGISFSAGPGKERYYKPFGLKMVIAAGYGEGDHSLGVDLGGGNLSPVMLPMAMTFTSTGEYPDFPNDRDWMYGRYQRFTWHNPDPNQPDIIFYFGHLSVDHVLSFKVGQEYPAGTVIGYLSDGGYRAVSRHNPDVDGYWIYIHTHVQLTQAGSLKDLVWWWKTYC